MHEARYFLPDHSQLRDVYSREELRAMLLSGRLKRSDIIVDDLTGHGHLLGDFLTWPDVKCFEENDVVEEAESPAPSPSPAKPRSESPTPAPAPVVVREVSEAAMRPAPAIAPAKTAAPTPPPLPGAPPPPYVEFRASTPLTTSRHSFPSEEAEDGDEEDEEQEKHPHSHQRFDPDEEDEEDDGEPTYFDEEDFDYFEDPQAHPMPTKRAPLRTVHSHADDEDDDGPHTNYVEPDLSASDSTEKSEDHEYLLHHFHPSWLSYRKALVAMLICAAVGYGAYRTKMNMAYPFTAGSFFILCFLNTWLDRSSIDYYITTRRVEAEVGLIGRNSDEIRITDIRAIDVQMKGFNALLGIGAINFSSGGGSLLDVHFKNVRNPHKIKRIVRDLLG